MIDNFKSSLIDSNIFEDTVEFSSGDFFVSPGEEVPFANKYTEGDGVRLDLNITQVEALGEEIFVTTAEELSFALDHATGGETIILAAGNYGDLAISPKSLKNSEGVYSETVTIRSANPDDPAVFTEVNIAGGQNIHFADLKFEFTPQEGDFTKTVLFNVRNWSPADRDSLNITVENSEFIGHPVTDGNGGDPNDPDDVVAHNGNVEGMSTGIAFSARNVDGLTFTDNEVSGFFRGATFSHSQDINVTNNYIHDLRSDGINFAAVQNVLIEGNEIRDMDPWRHTEARAGGDHADLIQFWTASTSTPSENIVIRNNLLHLTDGGGSQSIFMRNEMVDSGGAGEEMFYRNILIEDNVSYNSVANATRIGEGFDITIRNNTYIQNVDYANGSVTVPAITVALGSQGVVIENNIVPRIANQEAMEELGFVIRNNLLTQSSDPNGDNYVGDLFVDALSGLHSSVADLQIVPGSQADMQGVGAAMTQFDETPDVLTPLIRSFSGEYAGDDNQFVFDASLTADSEGFTNDGVTYLWDFGDGTQAEGQIVEHRFADHGEHTVTLTVVAEDGTTATNLIRAEVDDPTLFQLGLSEEGVYDASTYGTELTGEGAADAIVTLEDGSLAYHLTNESTLTLQRSASQLYSHDQFTFSMDLKRDMAADGGGYIMMWTSSMRLRISDEGVLNFELWNADEAYFELFSDIAIDDTEWHSLSVSYNAHEQVAEFYLDGELAGSAFMEGFTDVQESWGMQLGYTFKDNFEGLIRNVELSNQSYADDAEAITPLPTAPEPASDPEIDNYIQIDANGEIQGGTAENDHITGTEVDDIVKGGDGDDIFVMLDGDDIVNAGAGDDVMYGGAGNDILRGFSGYDIAYGGEGDDIIYSNVGYGEEGNDYLRGGVSDDYLSGGVGNDILLAAEGNDVLIGGAGVDQLRSGSGDDILVADLDDTLIYGGSGIDTVLFHDTAGTFDFDGKSISGVEIMDFTIGLENTILVDQVYQLRQSDTDELLIQGDVGDVVQIGIALDFVQTETRDGEDFDVYSNAQGTLVIDSDLSIDWII
jgi:PKD repeat protein